MYIEFMQLYRKYIQRLAGKLTPLYKLLQKDVPFKSTPQHKDIHFDINENLAKDAKLLLRLPLPDKQLVIMCDASAHAAGYVLLIEDNVEINNRPMRSNAAPGSFGSQQFTEGKMSLSKDEINLERLITVAPQFRRNRYGWKNRVSDLLSVITMVGFLTPQSKWAKSLKAKCIVRISFAYIVKDIWPIVNSWDPNETGAFDFIGPLFILV